MVPPADSVSGAVSGWTEVNSEMIDAEVTSGHAYGKAVDLWHLVRDPPLRPAARERCAERPHWMRFLRRVVNPFLSFALWLTVAQGVILYMLVTGHPPFRDFGTPH